MKSPAPPPPSQCEHKMVVRSAAAVYAYACPDSWKGGLPQSQVLVMGITPVHH